MYWQPPNRPLFVRARLLLPRTLPMVLAVLPLLAGRGLAEVAANASTVVERYDDAPLPLDARQPRSEAEEDRVKAVALFAAARLADRAGKHREALARYQRAFRYDPTNAAALERLTILSRALGQHTVTARYASHRVLLREGDPLDVLRAVIYLRGEGRPNEALRIYEKALAEVRGPARSPIWVELHKIAGELYLRQEKSKQAADALAQVFQALEEPALFDLDAETLKLVQGDVAALYGLIVDAMIADRRAERAEAVLQRAAQALDDQGVLLLGRARLAHQAGRDDEALKHLDLYLAGRFTSQGDAPYRLLAEVFQGLKRPTEFIVRLKQSAADDPENEPLVGYLAAACLKEDKLDDAREIYEKMLARKPGTTAYRGLVEVYRRAERIESLLTALGSAIGRTGMLSVLGAESAAISANAELFAGLVAEAERRLAAGPAQLPYGARLAVAMLACEAEKFDIAERYFKSAIDVEPEQKGLLLSTWGLALLAADKYSAAAEVFQRAIAEGAVSADNAALNYYLSGALAMDDQFDAALAAARKAAAPGAPPEYLDRVGWVLHRARRNDEARATYAELVRQHDADHSTPGLRDAVREARLTLAHLCVLAGDPAEAEQWLEQVLDEFPDSIEARNDLGYLWADQGKHLKRSLAMIREAVAAEPDNDAYRDSLGWVLFRLGRNDEALVELKRAAESSVPDGVVHDHLGDALEKVGRTDEALAAWRKAVDLLTTREDAMRRALVREKIERVEKSRRPDSAATR